MKATNFEKRMVLEYLIKILSQINLRHLDFATFLDEEFFNAFGVAKETFKEYFNDNCIDRHLIDNDRLRFMKKFETLILKLYSKFSKKTYLIDKQLLAIKDIYNLGDKEYQVLQYFAFKHITSFDYFFQFIARKNEDHLNIEKLLPIKHAERIEIYEKMYYKNILDSCNYHAEMNYFILDILNNHKFYTAEKIKIKLLGKPLKTKLTLNDFKHIENQTKDVINILSASVTEHKKGVNILLYGSVGTGKTEFAKLAANSLNIPIYEVATQKERFEELSREERLIDLSSKQYILQDTHSCILFDEAEDVMNTGFSFFNRNASKGQLNHVLETNSVPVIWTTNNIQNVDPAFLRRMTYTIEFEKLSELSRLNILKQILKKNKIKADISKIQELNNMYDVSPSIIANAASTAKMLNGDINDVEKFIHNVAQVVYKNKNIGKSNNFKRNEYDINLLNTDLNMDELTTKIKQTGKLNFSLCLYGEPGTGKSLYAKYLADKIGIDVIFKKASDLISCYVGETEKNIAKAFSDAKNKKAMLVIDEADSFLQNRNNAQRSWEVTQVNEMLTWMENHQYPFVCTTNLINSLDEASLRRFTFKIKFNFLNPEQVNMAVEHFFGISNANVNIKGLTTGDFATVKKKLDFLGCHDIKEIEKMLNDEVKVKKSPILQNTIGF